MNFDFSEDFASYRGLLGNGQPSPLQKLREEWSSKRLTASRQEDDVNWISPRPQELFASPRKDEPPRVQSGALNARDLGSVIAEPKEDAFVAARASVRRLEYEKLEMWISSGGNVEEFAPWFREMLMDQDDLAFISALRAVAAHYRRCAQQQALGDSMTPVPICWLSTLAERLWTPPASEKVAQEVAELVAACLAMSESSSTRQFFERFAGLQRGKVHLIAVCKEVLQREDLEELMRIVTESTPEQLPAAAWHSLPKELQDLAERPEEPLDSTASPSPVRTDGTGTTDSPATPWSLWTPGPSPKSWRQRVRCLEHLAERGADASSLWPQLLLQVEDAHPAISAAALQCIARLAPQMMTPADHLVTRLAAALRQRLKEPRCRLRTAAVDLLRSFCCNNSGNSSVQLLMQSLQLSKEQAKKAVAEFRDMSRCEAGAELPEALEALMMEAFPRPCAAGTPSPDRRLPMSPVTELLAEGHGHGIVPGEIPQVPKPVILTPRKVEVEPLRGSGLQLPWESTLLSFEATPQRPAIAAIAEEPASEKQVERSEWTPGHQEDSIEEQAPVAHELPRSLNHSDGSIGTPKQFEAREDHGELTWTFQKIHMITLDLSRSGCDEVSLLQQLATQLARPAFHGPLRRFLRRWLQRQRMKAAVKENCAPSDRHGKSGNLRMNDYASLRELCTDEDLPGAFPHSVLSQLRPLLSSSTRSTRPASQQAAVEALEQCAYACGPFAQHLHLSHSFAVPLLRLSTQRPHSAFRRSVAKTLLRTADGMRKVWRLWMQAAVGGKVPGTEQALVAESLHLVAQLEWQEGLKEVLQDILAVSTLHLEAPNSRLRHAATTCLRSLAKHLGTTRLQQEVSAVAPLRLNVVLSTLASQGPEASRCVPLERPRRKDPSPATSEVVPVVPTASEPGQPVDLEESEQSELDILEAQLSDAVTFDGRALELRTKLQDFSKRHASMDVVRFVLPALSYISRQCLDAKDAKDAEEDSSDEEEEAQAPKPAKPAAAEAEDDEESSDEEEEEPPKARALAKQAAAKAGAKEALQAAREVMTGLRTFSDEVLGSVESLPLFRSMLQILLELQGLNQREFLRPCTSQILLEMPPFLARSMEAIQVEKQLIAWLQLASELTTWRFGGAQVQLNAGQKTWASRFCARAVERCTAAMPRDGGPLFAWEVLSEVTRFGENPPGDEWPSILEALRKKMVELYPSEAHDFQEVSRHIVSLKSASIACR